MRRVPGIVYLLYFLAAFLGAFLMRGLVVPGDAATTAQRIVAHEGLYRSGFALALIADVIYIAVTALFFRLFERVDRTVSLMAALFSLAGCAVQLFGGIFVLAPLLLLRDGQLTHVFSVEQLQAVALFSVALHAQTFNTSLVLFAVYDLLLGYLILRSPFLPRLLGALMICAGVGWVTFLWPPLATALAAAVLPLGAVAELLLMVWLLVRGVDASQWQGSPPTVAP